MNAPLRRHGLLAAAIFVLLLIPIACTAPGYGGGGAATGAPAGAPSAAPAAPASGGGKYGY